MADLKIDSGGWVVVCDGAKALVLQNAGNRAVPRLTAKEVYEQPDPKTHEMGADRPGRAFSPAGGGRSAVEQTDWHDQAERDFLVQLAKHLDATIAAGKVKSLIIVAPPRALGMIRAAYPHALKAAVRVEIDKDLVKQPVHLIEKHLTGA